MNRFRAAALVIIGVVLLAGVVIGVTAGIILPHHVGFGLLNYEGLLVAMSAGFFGATFSMLVQAQKRVSEGTLEDLRAASSWRTLAMRGAFGLGSAAILYFFFRSGLLEGTLWPNLDEIGFDPVIGSDGRLVPNQNLCLMVIWCFVAGFSETFIPNILVKTEKANEPV